MRCSSGNLGGKDAVAPHLRKSGFGWRSAPSAGIIIVLLAAYSVQEIKSNPGALVAIFLASGRVQPQEELNQTLRMWSRFKPTANREGKVNVPDFVTRISALAGLCCRSERLSTVFSALH